MAVYINVCIHIREALQVQLGHSLLVSMISTFSDATASYIGNRCFFQITKSNQNTSLNLGPKKDAYKRQKYHQFGKVIKKNRQESRFGYIFLKKKNNLHYFLAGAQRRVVIPMIAFDHILITPE